MNPERALSWSAISSFEYDPEQWYSKYVLNIAPEETKEMCFGKVVGEQLASNPSYLPQVPRHSHFEYKVEGQIMGIPLIGYIDSYEPHHALAEYKTGKRAWTNTRVENHGQIDMYLLLLHIMYSVRPENIAVQLVWLPTEETGDFQIRLVDEKDAKVFRTSRTMKQLLQFGVRIKDTYDDMVAFAANHD